MAHRDRPPDETPAHEPPAESAQRTTLEDGEDRPIGRLHVVEKRIETLNAVDEIPVHEGSQGKPDLARITGQHRVVTDSRHFLIFVAMLDVHIAHGERSFTEG